MKRISITTILLTVIILGCDETPVFPGNGPEVPRNPAPAMGVTDQDLTLALSWECSSPDGRALTYDVYIGREASPPLKAVGIAQPSYVIENLTPNRRYFWRIAARDDRGLVQDGPIWYFDTASSAWAQYSSPTTSNLNGVSINGDSGWAAGDTGTLLRFDSGQWSNVSTSLLSNLNDIAWDGTTGYCVGNNGAIIKLTSAGWSTETSPTSENLHAVALDGNGGAWAVGGTGTILRLADSIWTVVSVPIAAGHTLYDVAVSDAGNVLIAASDAKVFYWDGSEWSEETAAPGSTPSLTDITSVGYSGYGNATGFWAGNVNGKILHRSVSGGGTVTWVDYGKPYSAPVNALDFESGGFGMAAFDAGRISRFDGSGWTTGETIASADLNDVAYLSAGEAWAVGNGGVIYHYSPVE